MTRRVTRSLLDPWILPAVPGLYRSLHIPRRLPPEAIVVCGHVIALTGAVGFAFGERAWGGLLACAGVIGNHLCDMVDGTHARRTGQCRNGGELLDHFTDPLSFSAWLVGMAVAVDAPWLGVAGVVVVLATAVLTNIRAKLTGEFILRRFGPTEFKALLALHGALLAAGALASVTRGFRHGYARAFLVAIVAVGAAALARQLVESVQDVNARGGKPDTSEWRCESHSAARSERGRRGRDLPACADRAGE